MAKGREIDHFALLAFGFFFRKSPINKKPFHWQPRPYGWIALEGWFFGATVFDVQTGSYNQAPPVGAERTERVRDGSVSFCFRASLSRIHNGRHIGEATKPGSVDAFPV